MISSTYKFRQNTLGPTDGNHKNLIIDWNHLQMTEHCVQKACFWILGGNFIFSLVNDEIGQ